MTNTRQLLQQGNRVTVAILKQLREYWRGDRWAGLLGKAETHRW